MNFKRMLRMGFSTSLLLVASGVLMSCAPNTTAPELQSAARPTNTPAGGLASSNIQPTNSALPPFTDSACLDCHTDQARLVSLAKPLPVVEALSEGPG